MHNLKENGSPNEELRSDIIVAMDTLTTEIVTKAPEVLGFPEHVSYMERVETTGRVILLAVTDAIVRLKEKHNVRV